MLSYLRACSRVTDSSALVIGSLAMALPRSAVNLLALELGLPLTVKAADTH